jgi:hypothetical protein
MKIGNFFRNKKQSEERNVLATQFVVYLTTYHEKISLKNIEIELLDLSFSDFILPVEIINCRIEKLKIQNSSFYGGFKFENNVLKSKFYYPEGGPNKGLFLLCGNEFYQRVSFADTFFDDEVYIKNNNFRQGSTFLSDAKTYNWKLIQENNTGDIYLDYIDFMGDGPDSNTYNEL